MGIKIEIGRTQPKHQNSFVKAMKWLGRKISYGCKNYILPALQAIGNFLRTGVGIGILGVITASVLMGVALLVPSEHRLSNRVRIVMLVLSILCFVGAGVAFASGMTVII